MLAKYIRLSDADEDVGDQTKAESNSVVNQRALLGRYLAESTEFSGLPALEFLDDGRSGTNFDRPGIRALLAAAQRGEIDCVIVKDFSRFGRTHLEVGKYLEQVFPFLGIRFISVLENYDSKKLVYGTAGDLDTELRNLINELYSRDLSEKVKAAKRQYAKRGQYISAYSFFGYVKSEEDKRKLVLDPPAATVVRRIFALHIGGMPCRDIAAILNQEGVMTPTARKKELGAKRQAWNSEREKNEWTGAAVLGILREERYTGKLISCRTTRKELGKAAHQPLASKDWIVVSNAFKAIVTEEEYAAAQAQSRRAPRDSHSVGERHLFHRKMQCGICGLAPNRSNSTRTYYKCGMTAWNAADGCGEVRIYEDELIRAVLTALHHQANLAVQEMKAQGYLPDGGTQQRQQEINTSLARVTSQKKKTFYQLCAEKISQTQYEAALTQLKEQERICQAQLASLSSWSAETSDLQAHRTLLAQCADLQHLTAELVEKLIRRIRIYAGGRIEIVWNFKEPDMEWVGE